MLYRLNQQAVWSDGREIGAPDFVAQWRALSGKDSAFWTARNAGYERIDKIERGADDLEVKVTFAKPYADWRSLFSPLYPKQVTGSPDAFNDGARSTLKATAGPFRLREVDKETGSVTLARNPRWWGSPAKLDSLVFKAVKPQDRTEALTEGKVDVADIDAAAANRIVQASRDAGGNGAPPAHGPGSEVTPAQALRSWALAHGSDEEVAEEAQEARDEKARAAKAYAAEQSDLRGYVVRKSLEPAYTQLALNGESGPLADDRVRRAVARALDRQELADTVLKPLGLPAEPLGSHLALAGQPAYKDGSDALGSQDAKEAQALLADAGWTREGALKKTDGTKAGSEGEKQKDAGKKEEEKAAEKEEEKAEKSDGAKDDGKTDDAARREPSEDDGLYIVGDDNKPGEAGGVATHVIAPAPAAAVQSAALLRQAGHLGETGTSEDAPPGSPPRTGSPAERPVPTPRSARRLPSRPPTPPAARSVRTARRCRCGSSCRRVPAPSPCAASVTRSRRCWTPSGSVPRSPRSPTTATSGTTSPPVTTTWPCTPGPPPPTRPRTTARSSRSRCPPPTARCSSSRTTPASARTTSTSSSTRRSRSSTRRRPGI